MLHRKHQRRSSHLEGVDVLDLSRSTRQMIVLDSPSLTDLSWRQIRSEHIVLNCRLTGAIFGYSGLRIQVLLELAFDD